MGHIDVVMDSMCTEVGTDLQTFDAGLETFDACVETFDADLETFDTGLETLNTDLETFDAGLETLDTGLETLYTDLETLYTDLEILNLYNYHQTRGYFPSIRRNCFLKSQLIPTEKICPYLNYYFIRFKLVKRRLQFSQLFVIHLK